MFYYKNSSDDKFGYCQNKVFFAGSDKGRADKIRRVYDYLNRAGISSDIRMISKNKDSDYIEKYKDFIFEKSMDYGTYLSEISKCDCLLEINQNNQIAPSMRVLEALFFSKKLITNNKHISDYSFYKYGNVFIFDDDDIERSLSGLDEFLRNRFNEYDKDVLCDYGYEHWLKGFDDASSC